jgi:voltage-gated potassium channel
VSVVSATPKPRKRVVDYIIKSTNSVGELLLLYLALVVVSGLAFAWFEHKSVGDGLWWAVVTTTTTGYGDLSPASLAGRLTGAATMMISILIVLPLLIGHIAARLIENHDAFTHEEQEMLKAEIIALRADLARLAASRASEP